ncbi:MAG: hypothetical protein AB7Q17_16550 [Phycisphaerae bacterium]
MALDEHARKIFQSVLRSIEAGRSSDAVHQFVQALSHDTNFKRIDLPPLLTRALGRAQTDALIEAFAVHPCMVCKRGLLLCEECDGKGASRSGRICDKCIGLGAANCDFCGGSGWITYNYVPNGLQAAVVLARSKLALAETRALLDAPLPGASGGGAVRKQLAQHLLRLNRLLGAFNNALGVAQHPPDTGPAADAVLKKVEAASWEAARRLDRRLRQVLLRLEEHARATVSRGADGEQGERRADYYHKLAKSPDFTGTSLHHVYLRELHRRRSEMESPAPPAREPADSD